MAVSTDANARSAAELPAAAVSHPRVGGYARSVSRRHAVVRSGPASVVNVIGAYTGLAAWTHAGPVAGPTAARAIASGTTRPATVRRPRWWEEGGLTSLSIGWGEAGAMPSPKGEGRGLAASAVGRGSKSPSEGLARAAGQLRVDRGRRIEAG